MARALALGTVVELQKAVEAACLGVRLHLHDACGAQSFSLEAVGEADFAGARALIEERLSAAGAPPVEFSSDGSRFWVLG